MKRLTICTLAAVALLGLSGVAQAQNTAEGPGAAGACSDGSGGECFAPHYTFVGEIAKYSGTGLSPTFLTVRAADCCLTGDKYKVLSKTGGQSGLFTTTHTIPGVGCFPPWSTLPSSVTTQAGSTGKVNMKILVAGGGIPADAYLKMSTGSWVQTAGGAACGL